MTATKAAFDHLLKDLQRQREELNLQMHLAKAEAKDEWQALEKKWRGMKPKMDAAGAEAMKTGGKDEWQALEREWRDMKPKRDGAGSEAMKSGENVLAGLQLTLEELRKG